MNVLLKPILWSISLIYGGVLVTRHWMYDFGLLKSYCPKVFTISIGNLALGGSGKTPFLIMMAKELSKKYQIAIISRGYGRKSKGMLQAQPHHTSKDIGDEPFMVQNALGKTVPIFLCANRTKAIQYIEKNLPQINLILLDDAMQHRAISPHISLLLSQFSAPFFSDFLLPMGKLRDLKSRYKSAQAIIGTYYEKNDQNLALWGNFTKKTSIPIFFSKTKYLQPISIFSNTPTPMPNRCIAISAIANPKMFLNYLNQNTKVCKTFLYRDHYFFNQNDINEWINACKLLKIHTMITTEKDANKLLVFKNKFNQNKITILVLPIELEVETKFWDKILQRIKKSEKIVEAFQRNDLEIQL